MPKPSSKHELLARSQQAYQQLMNLIEGYSQEELTKEFPTGSLNRNVRDILAHLHHWHLMMASWYEVGMRGDKPDMPAKGYSWKTLPDLNRHIWQIYQEMELETVLASLQDSYQQVQTIIQQHSEEELFEKKRFAWTGSTSLGAYLISNTSSHYEWAIKRIKKSMK
ncbi:MAG: ClbS/DfsB family four-helix bundle protein [Bacteroidota bacterium]